MDWNDYAEWAQTAGRWARDYHSRLRDAPVRSQAAPGETLAALPESPPDAAESMEAIFADFERLVPGGLTHWQHPRFFAYFPANVTPASALAEQLVSSIGAQCMLWQTSPVATEMETRMMQWLRQGLGLCSDFHGVIQDSASSATLAAVLCMRERALQWRGNTDGLSPHRPLRLYASQEVHTSVDRAVWVAGIGQNNLVRIPTAGPLRAMDPTALREAIERDIQSGYLPAGIIACVGATGVGSTDTLPPLVALAREFQLYLHVDAAWAGAAMICPELRDLWQGIDGVDSLVLNPHKWLGVQFDCSAHFLRDPGTLVQTLAMKPEYLATHEHQDIVNYSEWSVPLGRRFRALKLWFVIRAYGLDGLRDTLRQHVQWAQALAQRLGEHSDFEITTPPVLSLFSFRYRPQDSRQDLSAINLALVQKINDDGRLYLTQTRLDGDIVIRCQVGAWSTTAQDIETAHDVICELARAG